MSEPEKRLELPEQSVYFLLGYFLVSEHENATNWTDEKMLRILLLGYMTWLGQPPLVPSPD